VLASARRELLTVVREQAVSRTLHRFGHLPGTVPGGGDATPGPDA
jgi:RHH-type proline utilization regulon transcriptional repressor/proline dehydrogenase/delta 1-pyrroline-5-carboxylate dehydrogenase